MGSLFNWIRRRRIFNEKIPQNVLTKMELFNLGCKRTLTSPQCQIITSIILAQDVTCVLMKNGMSVVLDHISHKKLCVLNDPLFSDSIIRSLCYNRWNDTIISIWHSVSCNYGLRISIFDRRHVKEGVAQPLTTALKLQNLVIPYPGFIELEESYGRIVTSTPDDQLFRFWNIRNYEVDFTMDNTDFKEIRISRRTVAFFRQPENNYLPVKLCSILDGKVLVEHKIPLQPAKELRFLELCEDCLLIKQEGSCIHVYNMLEGKDNRIENTKLFLPNAVTFFTEEFVSEMSNFPNKFGTQFLAVHNECMEICCCFNGQLIRLTKISIPPPIVLSDCLQVLPQKNVIMVYTSRKNTTNSHCRIHQLPFRNSYYESKDTNLLTDDSIVQEKCVGKYQQSTNLATDESGLSVIDIRSGEEIIFIPFHCNDVMNVIVYDAVQKEILAGGRQGLHRIGTNFRLIESYPERVVCAQSPRDESSTRRSAMTSHFIQLEKASTVFTKKINRKSSPYIKKSSTLKSQFYSSKYGSSGKSCFYKKNQKRKFDGKE